MKKVVLDFNPRAPRALREHPQAPNCCRHHMVVLPGYGDKNFRFPDKQTLVNRALARLEQRYNGKKDLAAEQSADEAATDGGGTETDLFGGTTHELIDGAAASPDTTPLVKHRIRFDRSGVPPLVTAAFAPEPVIFKLPEAEQRNLDGTLFLTSAGVATIMDEGKYDAIVAERFDPLAGAVNWAREHMEARYQSAIASLKKQLDALQRLYKEALPRVLAVLSAQNPDVHPKRLEAAAVEVLDEELVQILTVLRIWTDAFAQRRDGMYKQLRAVTFLVEQAYKLQTQCGGDGCNRIQTVVFQIGNVFVARFSNQGPATFPGTRGPIGAHAIEVPHDERKMISLMLVLYTHEFRHNIFADIDGLSSEMTQAVISQIHEAHAAGKFKFSTEKIAFGKNKFNIIDMLAKISADTIGEVDADIAGGVLQSGTAYLYAVIMTFSAMNAGIEGITNTAPLLRSHSYYELSSNNGQTSLDFLPHPPDYIRAYIVAAAMDEIGFPAEAEECRRLADQAVGYPLPEYITWGDVEGKSKAVIKVAVSDLKQIAPVVAKAIIRTPLKSLGGACMFDIVNWTHGRQAKVDALTKILMNGGSNVPTDLGDIEATYIGPAATMAYWGLVKSGVRPLVALHTVNENALKMLDTVRERKELQEQEQAAKAAANAAACGCGNAHDPSVVHATAPGAAPAADGTVEGEPEADEDADGEEGAPDDGDAGPAA